MSPAEPYLPKDDRIRRLLDAIHHLQAGEFDLELPTAPADELGRLGRGMEELARSLQHRRDELQHFDAITCQINTGLLLDELLEKIYLHFRQFVPYDRLGLSLLNLDDKTLRAHWAKADYEELKLARGYTAPLQGSSLESVIRSGRPRILNDLVAYLESKPESDSTRLIVAEGLRSSLTCPLIANGVPVGFLFFSNRQPGAYAHAHVDSYQRLAQQLSIMVEKSRLVSQLAEQKAAIETQNQELRQLSDLKSRFLGMAAHDLRNPIGNIRFIADLLADPDSHLSDQERRGFLREIREQADYMLPLLNQLLDVSHAELGQFSLQKEPLDLAAFLEETVHRHGYLAKPKGTRIVLQPVPPGPALADPLRLRQILDNLISNAVKYSPPHSLVKVQALRGEHGWRLEVEDQGPGLTPDDRSRLFQDFTRLSAQPTAGERSTGLGLAIARRMVEAHGGQIGVDSEPGRGATFWFTLTQ